MKHVAPISSILVPISYSYETTFQQEIIAHLSNTQGQYSSERQQKAINKRRRIHPKSLSSSRVSFLMNKMKTHSSKFTDLTEFYWSRNCVKFGKLEFDGVEMCVADNSEKHDDDSNEKSIEKPSVPIEVIDPYNEVSSLWMCLIERKINKNFW